MDMSSKPNIDRAIFDVLCLCTDVDTDKIAGKLTMRQFAENVIEPMQHGKAHLRYSADGVLLWFFSWLPINDNDLKYMKENDCTFPDRFEILQRKSVYAQMKGQIESLQEAMKNQAGTIETLERQLVQSNIRDKSNTASNQIDKELNKNIASQRLIRSEMENQKNQQENVDNKKNVQ